MSEQRPKQLVSVSVVCALLLGVLVVAFGTGYQVSHASASEGSAWLAKEDSYVHVNPETLKPDAEARAPGLARGPLPNATDLGTGSVYLNDGLSGYRALDPTTMVPGRRQPGRVIAGGTGKQAAAYVVDGRKIGPADKPGTVASAPARIGTSVVDGTGTAWLLSGKKLYWYDGSALRKLADPGFRADWLTLVDNRPVVISDRGDVARIDEHKEPEGTLHLKLTWGNHISAVNDPSSTGSVAWAVLKPSRTLVGVDLTNGIPNSVPLAGASNELGPPVTSSGRLYVPDYGKGNVVRLNGRSLHVDPPIKAPLNRRGAMFQVFAKDGYLWVNDPKSREASVIDPDGRDWRFGIRLRSGDSDEDGRPSPSSTPRPSTPPLPIVHRTPSARPSASSSQSPGNGPSTTWPGDGTTVVEYYYPGGSMVVVEDGSGSGSVITTCPPEPTPGQPGPGQGQGRFR